MKSFIICLAVVFTFTSFMSMGQKRDTFTDIRDGQVYSTVKIGQAVWMAQNLNYYVRGSWCYNDNDEMCKKFGRLYTWQGAMNGRDTEKSQGICPEGWHVPSFDEWQALSDEYKKSKDLLEGGSSGLNLTLGGGRFPDGKYDFIDKVATFWTSTIDSSNTQFVYTFYAYQDQKNKPLYSYSTSKTYGQYIRCVKD
ncbi:MAG: FISUMP domain-containing protein [Bacteroidales bacterium]